MEQFLLPIVFAVLGYVVGRWWIVALALVVCIGTAVFLAANNGWNGNGWGDYGITLNLLAGCLTLASAAIGVAVRRA